MEKEFEENLICVLEEIRDSLRVNLKVIAEGLKGISTAIEISTRT